MALWAYHENLNSQHMMIIVFQIKKKQAIAKNRKATNEEYKNLLMFREKLTISLYLPVF